MELLVAWGVTNAVTFIFKEVLTKLAKEALEDYVKDFFKGCIKDLVDLDEQKALKIALGQALKEFLALFQQELEDAEIDSSKITTDYTKSLNNFIHDKSVLETLGKPFQEALGKSSTDNSQFIYTTLSQIWHDLNLQLLPKEFNWSRLINRYGKKVKAILQESDKLREILDSENLENIREQLQQITPISPNFDFSRYQEGLKAVYGKLRLDTLDTSGCNYSLQLWNMFVPQNVRDFPETSNQNQSSSVLNLLNEKRNYKYTVILGDPGSGKSTLVQYHTLQWARMQPSDIPLRELPLLIELRNYIENHKKSHCNNFIEYWHQGNGVSGGNLDRHGIDDWLKHRESIILFDGLDEILDRGERENVVIDIINFTTTYPKARILVTSRVIGYEPQQLRNAKFQHFMLQPLESEQIKRFITQWHELAFENRYEGVKKRDRLQTSIDNSPAFRELAGNPLLLTMMAILNRHEELPRDRATLYNQASQVLLQRWDAGKNLPTDPKLDPKINSYIYIVDYKEKQEMLRQVAYSMQSSTSSNSSNLVISTDELQTILTKYLETQGHTEARILANVLMNNLITRSFILCFMGGDDYGFVHRSFQEYFCAWYFTHQYEKTRNLTLDDLSREVFSKNWNNPSWHEILKLITCMIDEKFAEELIDCLMLQEGDTNEFKNLFLASECLLDVRNRRRIAVTDKLLKELKQLADDRSEVTASVRDKAKQSIAALEEGMIPKPNA